MVRWLSVFVVGAVLGLAVPAAAQLPSRALFGWDGSNWRPVLVDTDGHVQVDSLSGGGGGGDASAANQTTQITHLSGGMGYLVLDAMDVTTGWTVLNTDAATLATTTDNVEGSAALSFDKADSAANTIYGMIQKTLASVDLSPYGPSPVLKVRFQATTYADMINIVVRLGVDASNYLEFLCAPTGAPVSVWSECYIPLTSTTAAAVGTGWDSTDIDHIQVGAQFSDEADTLVGLLIDEIVVQAGLPQSSEQWDKAFLPEGGTHDTGERGVLAFGVRQDAQVDFAADGSRVPLSIDGSGRARVEATSTVLTDIELNTQSLVDNQVTASTHDTPVDATGLNLICEAADVDGSALPNVATAEGRGGRPKCSTAFVLLTAPTDETGLNPGFDLEGNALGAGVLLQGDDGTDRTNLLVDTAGHPQVDVLTMPSVVDHDAADTDPRLGIGLRALAHGTNPTAVAASDRTVWYGNRAGIPFMIGGHPNVITLESQVQDADGAQTNLALVTVGAGAKVVVTRASFKCSNANTVDVTAVLGFGTATIPARAHTGVTGIVASFDEIPAGGGSVEGSGAGILGIGADNEDLRLTMDDPVSGACVVNVSYYTIES